MPIRRIKEEETLHLRGDLRGGSSIFPFVQKPLEHLHGSETGDFTQSAVHPELLVRHAHILLVSLHVIFADGLKLRGGRRLFDRREREIPEVFRPPAQERTQIPFADTSDGVDISGRAVVLSHVPAQTLVDVRAPEHKKETVSSVHPRHELRQNKRKHHPDARLNVLQREVFNVAAAIHLEFRCSARDHHEKRDNRGDHRVNFDVEVRRPYLISQGFGTTTGLVAAVLRAEVHRGKHSRRELFCRWDGRVVVQLRYALYVRNRARVAGGGGLRRELTHRANKSSSGRAVRATRER